MAKHYETTGYEVTSDTATDTEAIIRVVAKSDGRIIARVFVQAQVDAVEWLRKAQLIADATQYTDDNPGAVPDWVGGKTGIDALPTIP